MSEAPGTASGPGSPAVATWRAETEGIAVEAAMERLDDAPAWMEGHPVEVRFTIRDTTTGEPISGLFPAAWMDRLPAGREREVDTCQDKVEAYLGGTLFAEAEVNLNVYYVLALNDDATITVVDPLFGFGGTKLLALIQLESTGEDWALSADGRTLWVSMPAVDRLAEIDTAVWKVSRTIEVGARPVELALQPDGRYLWVAAEGTRPGFGPSGVTVVDTATGEVARHVATGRGPHHLAFSSDDRWALVTDGRDGRVTVVDVRRLEVARRIPLVQEDGSPGRPAWIAWSDAADRAYVSDATGAVVSIDPRLDEPVTRMKAEAPGLGRIAFAPGGRYAFAVNPSEDLVHIVDAASDRIVQTADVERAPDQVAFSDELAYVRHAGSETVLMIPLSSIGTPGAPVPVIDFPGGQEPPGEGTLPTPAPAIVQAPGATAVLVANPADGTIYYYKEGMAAPMGSFKNYERQARAVEVVDRSLEEGAPGTYSTAVQLRRPGTYDLAFFLDSPRMIHCFEFAVEENPEIVRERQARRVDIEVVEVEESLTAGEETTVRFRLRDPATGAVRTDVDDVRVLTFLAPGVWQRRQDARRVGEDAYEVTFTPPEPGLYYVFFESASVGMGYNRSPSFILEAHRADAVARGAEP